MGTTSGIDGSARAALSAWGACKTHPCSSLVSTRQSCRIESAVTYPKQGPLLQSTRQCFDVHALRSSRNGTLSPLSISRFFSGLSGPAFLLDNVFRVDFAPSHSKQTIEASATRQFSRGVSKASSAIRLESPSRANIVSRGVNSFRSQKGVNPCQVFAPVNLSKQTTEVRKGCQFFAMCFSTAEKSQIAETA